MAINLRHLTIFILIIFSLFKQSNVPNTASPSGLLEPIIHDNPNTVVALDENLSGIITYVSEQQYNIDLVLLNLDDNSKIRLKQPNSDEYSPAWSSDGCSLAYLSDNQRSGVLSDIFIISADKPESFNVTEALDTDASDFTYPSWSPDGKKLSFTSNMGEGFGLYTLNLADMSTFRVTPNKLEVDKPDWSPDGTKIAFGAEVGSNVNLYVVNTDGSNLKNISNYPASDYFPSWSPDGSQLAFSSNRDGNWEIYVMDADGSNLKRLTVDSEIDAEPDWSPDGKRIAFSSRRTGNWEIYVMDADGSNVKQLTDDAVEPFAVNQNPRWQPAVCNSFIDSIIKKFKS